MQLNPVLAFTSSLFNALSVLSISVSLLWSFYSLYLCHTLSIAVPCSNFLFQRLQLFFHGNVTVILASKWFCFNILNCRFQSKFPDKSKLVCTATDT